MCVITLADTLSIKASPKGGNRGDLRHLRVRAASKSTPCRILNLTARSGAAPRACPRLSRRRRGAGPLRPIERRLRRQLRAVHKAAGLFRVRAMEDENALPRRPLRKVYDEQERSKRYDLQEESSCNNVWCLGSCDSVCCDGRQSGLSFR
jgi:hypothetical protein